MSGLTLRRLLWFPAAVFLVFGVARPYWQNSASAAVDAQDDRHKHAVKVIPISAADPTSAQINYGDTLTFSLRFDQSVAASDSVKIRITPQVVDFGTAVNSWDTYVNGNGTVDSQTSSRFYGNGNYRFSIVTLDQNTPFGSPVVTSELSCSPQN